MSQPENVASWPRALREALAGELIGAAVVVDRAPGIAGLPLDGVIADETLHTLLLRLPGRGRLRRVAKRGLEGTILLGEREIPLRGELLRQRPEDRTKRLLSAGRRRFG
ncbi:MAG: ribonuclease P protein subunit [Thermoplasmata archaeon]